MIDIQYLHEFKDIINHTNIISKTDIHGIITYANDNFCQISWYTREELIGKSHTIIRHPDMPDSTFQEMWDTIKNKKQTWQWIIKNKKKDGSYYWLQTSVSPVLDPSRNIIEYISIRSDITKLKNSIKLNNDYKSILDQANLVVILDKNWVIDHVNEKFCSISNYKVEELIGKVYIDFITKSILEPVDKVYQEVLWIVHIKEKDICDIIKTIQDKKNWRGIIKNKWKIGNIFWTSTMIMPIFDYDNNLKQFYLIQNDITDLEIAKNQLKKSFRVLRELDQKKDDFINITSHELRTPMTAIKWYVSMILDGDIGSIDAEANMYLSKIYNNVQNLINLINDMLDISKMESGKMAFFSEKIDIYANVFEVVKELSPMYRKKHIKLINNIQDIDLFFIWDKMKFRQVILNILSNAIKFTPENGQISITSLISRNKIYISIQDTGIWITPEDLKKIFKKFYQVKNSLTRDISGTWLGLSIVKDILKYFDGDIEVQSTIWVGTTFTIILPYSA